MDSPPTVCNILTAVNQIASRSSSESEYDFGAGDGVASSPVHTLQANDDTIPRDDKLTTIKYDVTLVDSNGATLQ